MSVSVAHGVVAVAPKVILAGTNVTVSETDTTITINATGGSGGASWGGVTGTLSDQTDLQNALDAKADSSSVPAQFNPIAGSNVSLTGTYPNITFSATATSGAAVQKQVTLDFGLVPVFSKGITFSDAEITATSKVIMTAAADDDELEMDGFVCSVVCGTGTATAYVQAIPGPVKGTRKFNYLIG